MNPTLTRNGFIAAALMNIGGVLLFSRAFTNNAINQADPVVMSDFGLGEVKGGNIISIMLFGAALGAFLFPHVASKYGVKKMSLAVAILATLLWLVFHFETSFFIYFSTRCAVFSKWFSF